MNPELIVDTPISFSLLPYSGSWTKKEASHLLRRTLFGPTFNQIQTAVSDGLNTTVSKLLTLSSVSLPLTYQSDEAIVSFGSSWVNSVYPSGDSQPTENARNSSLAAWMMSNLNGETLSISEKICLFWHNHFAAENSFDARATYNYHKLIRTHALGNFKQLVKEMTIDPSMLLFLNGVSNQWFSPNENFAREFLELYTIGKGPQIDVGDYTNYKESDVSAGSKIFTGWTIDGLRSTILTSPVAVFNPAYHDVSKKQLSSHFNNSTIASNGINEYAQYIDLVFQQPAVATFICTKLYRFFVNYEITLDVETNVIPEMATTFISNNYDIVPVLDQLFKSEHFYDVSLRGALIKNPLELIFSMLNTSQSKPNFDLATNYEMYINFYWYAGALGMFYGKPPNVGGWPAYYQTPSFSKLWINSTSIKQRFEIGYVFSLHQGLKINNHYFKANALNLVNGLSNPSDAVSVVDDLTVIFFPKDVSPTAKLVLKGILTNGLPDFEWTVQYNAYQADSSNVTKSDPVRIRIESVLFQIFQMPEFQTI